VLCCAGGCRCRMELIKPAVDWRKAGVKVNTMGAAVAK
jgi:UDP-sulfoquinovose synthase